MQQAYKAHLYDFEDSKASVLGDYLASKLEMDEGEMPVYAVLPGDYKGSMVVVFKNGKAARFSMESFETKTNRRRLTGAYSDKAPAVAFFHPIEEESEITMFSTANRALTFRASMLDVKTTRSDAGRADHGAARQAYHYAGGAAPRTLRSVIMRATAAAVFRPSAHCLPMRICRISSSNCFNAKRRGFPLRFFSAPILRGTRTAAGVFVLTGRLFFCTG